MGHDRRITLSQTDKNEICDLITMGLTRSRAFFKYGIDYKVARKKLFEEDPNFLRQIEIAEVDFEVHHINRIAEGKFNWQSSSWLLERKFPKRWGRKDNRGLPGNGRQQPQGLFTINPQMVPVALPQGAVPALPREEEVQDSEGGETVGEDGELQEEAGDVPVGALPAQPPPADSPVDRPPLVRRRANAGTS